MKLWIWGLCLSFSHAVVASGFPEAPHSGGCEQVLEAAGSIPLSRADLLELQSNPLQATHTKSFFRRELTGVNLEFKSNLKPSLQAAWVRLLSRVVPSSKMIVSGKKIQVLFSDAPEGLVMIWSRKDILVSLEQAVRSGDFETLRNIFQTVLNYDESPWDAEFKKAYAQRLNLRFLGNAEGEPVSATEYRALEKSFFEKAGEGGGSVHFVDASDSEASKGLLRDGVRIGRLGFADSLSYFRTFNGSSSGTTSLEESQAITLVEKVVRSEIIEVVKDSRGEDVLLFAVYGMKDGKIVPILTPQFRAGACIQCHGERPRDATTAILNRAQFEQRSIYKSNVTDGTVHDHSIVLNPKDLILSDWLNNVEMKKK